MSPNLPTKDPERDRLHDQQVDTHEQPLLEHLIELRARLLRIVLGVFVAFIPLYFYAKQIYHFVAAPMLAALPKGSTMIATEVASTFLTPFKLSMWAAVFVAIPYILHQAWGFVAPGLYSHEKRFTVPLLATSVLLFYLGAAFAYYLVFPAAFRFFVASAPLDVAVMTDISHYLDFALTMFFAFGAAFEIPIAVFLLVRTGIATVESLVAKRPYVIVGCFAVGAVLTPPDILSQCMMAIPMWFLYEIGVLVCRLTAPKRPAATDGESATATSAGSKAIAGTSDRPS